MSSGGTPNATSGGGNSTIGGSIYGVLSGDIGGQWVDADDVISALYAGWGRGYHMMEGIVAGVSSIVGRMNGAKFGGLVGDGAQEVPNQIMVQVITNSVLDMFLMKRKAGRHSVKESLETAAVGKVGKALWYDFLGFVKPAGSA